MYFAFELYFFFILGLVRWDAHWRGGGGGGGGGSSGKTHAVRSVPFRQTGLASGFKSVVKKRLPRPLYGEWETE